MTAAEIAALRRWSAENLMGWQQCYEVREGHYCEPNDDSSVCRVKIKPINAWRPDDPDTGQIWMCVERMRELGWHFRLEDAAIFPKGHSQWIARFTIKHGPTFTMDEKDFGVGQDANPCLAMLLAMRSALTAGREGS